MPEAVTSLLFDLFQVFNECESNVVHGFSSRKKSASKLDHELTYVAFFEIRSILRDWERSLCRINFVSL